VSGFRFRKEFQIAPGIRLNIGKTGASVSLGPDDFHITTGTHGTSVHIDLPGSGMYYRKNIKLRSDKDGNDAERAAEAPPLDIGFIDRLTKTGDELTLIEALRAFYAGDDQTAYAQASKATSVTDGLFLAGILALKLEDYENAVTYLRRALETKENLGKMFSNLGLNFSVNYPVTEEILTDIYADERGILLVLNDAYQRLGKPEIAIEILQQLYQLDPDDLITRLSLAELYDMQYPDAEQMNKRIVELAEGVHNISPLHANLMYYRARALRRLGLYEAAMDTLTKALRRKKDYPPELLVALRYERGLVHEAMGDTAKAKAEFQKVFAEAPTFEEVAAKVGL